MKKALRFRNRSLLVLLLWISPMLLYAQNEVARERSSLQGIRSMAFSVNYEANAPLAEKKQTGIAALQKMGEQQLQKAGIALASDEALRQSAQTPLLYMHINAMDAGRGLVPFAINLYFYQPVKLPLNRDIQTTASTWESGTLGLVSYDELGLIREAARGLLNEFITDYKEINNLNSN